MAGINFIFTDNEVKIEKKLNYDDFMKDESAEDERFNKVAVILSKKNITINHKERELFIYKLKDVLGDKLDIFGVGFNSIGDKFDILKKYKYSLVIENNHVNDYWSEKLSDAFLCGTFPFYYGCKNIHKYFDEEELQLIDIDNVNNALNVILNNIDNNVYDTKKHSIKKAKYKVLNEYNIFAVLNKIIVKYYKENNNNNIQYTIKTEKRDILNYFW